MPITIDGVPEYLTRDQYVALFAAFGFTPGSVIELRAAPDGVHALVKARDETGAATPNKHRVFIPVRDGASDERATRITSVLSISDEEALAVLAMHGMTGADATTALTTWKNLDDAARETHADTKRVDAVFRACSLV